MDPFVVVAEGDVFWVMQVCPEYLLSPVGACPYALHCDCQVGDAGALWMERGHWFSREEAQRRADVLSRQFWRDVERSAKVRERRDAGDVLTSKASAEIFSTWSDDDVPY